MGKINQDMLAIAQNEDLSPAEQAEQAGVSLSAWSRIRSGLVALGAIEARRGRQVAVLEDGGTCTGTVGATGPEKTEPSARVPTPVLKALGAEPGSALIFSLSGGAVSVYVEGKAKARQPRKPKKAKAA